jgi:hypothetical protein
MEIKEPEYQEDWSSIKFSGTALVKKANLSAEDLMINLICGGIEMQAVELNMMEIAEPPAALKAMADLDFINGQTFTLIQSI